MSQTTAKLLEVTKKIMDNFRAINDEDLIIAISDYLLGGNLFIVADRVPDGFTYEEALKFTVDDFNWDLEYPVIPTSVQLHLQGFDPIKFLIQGFEFTSNRKYLDLAAGLIGSWLDYDETNPDNRMVWYDHCVSDRSLTMFYFIFAVKNNGLTDYQGLIGRMDASLKKHGEFFFDDNNYKPGNHGTMGDRSLYLISKYFNDEDSGRYRDKAIKRMKDALKRDFSKNMVTLENSIQYHLFDCDMFVTIEKSLLNPFGDSLGDSFNQSSIESCTDFLIYASRPDFGFPSLGDGSNPTFPGIKKYSIYPFVEDYPPLKWLLTDGKMGKEPEELFKVYKDEGYAFFRNLWGYSRRDEAVYASFRSGFSIKYHKHADDLSFTLYSHGKNIFVDSGTYTHEYGDFRKFFMSALAHNTVVADGQNYPLLWGDFDETGIIDFGSEDDYYYVVGKNDMYKGINITRTLCFMKNGNIAIIDDIKSKNMHEYSQYYQLSPEIKIKDTKTEVSGGNVSVQIEDEELTVNIFQLGDCEVEFMNGDKDVPSPGIVSLDFGQLSESVALKFSKKSNDARFVTLISVDEDLEGYLDDGQLVVTGSASEVKIPLKDYPRGMSQYLQFEGSDASYSFTITDIKEGEQFAWYIYKGGDRFDKVWYSDTPVLKYDFKEPGDYQIKYFVKRENEKKMHTFPKIIHVTDEDIKNSEIYRLRNLNEEYQRELETVKETMEEMNVQIRYHQKTSECLQKKLEKQVKLKVPVKGVPVNKGQVNIDGQIRAIANTRPYRLAYFIRRFGHEFLRGNSKQKKSFMRWIQHKVLRKESDSQHRYNPLYDLIEE